MPLETFPASPEALFEAVYGTYGVIEDLESKRELVKERLRALDQIIPYPRAQGSLLLQQLNKLNMNINGLQEKALDLNQEAMLKVLRSSDVTNATKALRCTTGKCRLALDKLTQFENFMAVATSFLHFITKVYIATASAPIGFLAIASVIQDFDEVINIELANTLSPEDIKDILIDIRVDCTKVT